ncbi:hypothetical protein ABEF95_007557 [Exophiala dermatitidis]
MPISIFAPIQYLSSLVKPINTPTSDSQNTPGLTAGRDEADTIVVDSQGPRSTAILGPVERKRSVEEDSDEEPPRKRAMTEDRVAFLPHDDKAGSPPQHPGFSSLFGVSNSTRARSEIDRILMPPPATPRRVANLRTRPRRESIPKPDMAWRENDAVSISSSVVTRRRTEGMDDHSMEEARRHAAAIRLPPNSGIWSQAERELFFHLAYRGFEPLLPENWMLDFDTLPISLFAQGDDKDTPLIHNVRGNQFRACRALRQLFEAGHDVRDRTHVSPGAKREKILERVLIRYLHWALADVGLRSSNSNYVPVHMIITKRGGRSTLETLEEVATKLHGLSQRHRQPVVAQPSIEVDNQSIADVDQTRVVVDDDETLPTLFGMVIISSVIAIVTLSPFSPIPSQSPIRQTASPPDSDPGPNSSSHLPDFNPDRLRIIAELDFSQKDQDVWNALGVAIVAMQIRREALKANLGVSHHDPEALGDESMSIDGSMLDGLDETFGSFSRLDMEDDPDL